MLVKLNEFKYEFKFYKVQILERNEFIISDVDRKFAAKVVS